MDSPVTYANKYTVTLSNKEAFFSFQWIAPSLDETGRVTGQRVIREQFITLPLELAEALKASLNDLLKEPADESDSE